MNYFPLKLLYFSRSLFKPKLCPLYWVIFCWRQQHYLTLHVFMHDLLHHTLLPSFCLLRQNFWIMICWPSRKLIYSTKTYMWCLRLDDPSCLTIYIFVRYLSLTTTLFTYLFSALYYRGWKTADYIFKSIANWSTMGFLKVRHVQTEKKNNLCFCFGRNFTSEFQSLLLGTTVAVLHWLCSNFSYTVVSSDLLVQLQGLKWPCFVKISFLQN